MCAHVCAYAYACVCACGLRVCAYVSVRVSSCASHTVCVLLPSPSTTPATHHLTQASRLQISSQNAKNKTSCQKTQQIHKNTTEATSKIHLSNCHRARTFRFSLRDAVSLRSQSLIAIWSSSEPATSNGPKMGNQTSNGPKMGNQTNYAKFSNIIPTMDLSCTLGVANGGVDLRRLRF